MPLFEKGRHANQPSPCSNEYLKVSAPEFKQIVKQVGVMLSAHQTRRALGMAMSTFASPFLPLFRLPTNNSNGAYPQCLPPPSPT